MQYYMNFVVEQKVGVVSIYLAFLRLTTVCIYLSNIFGFLKWHQYVWTLSKLTFEVLRSLQ